MEVSALAEANCFGLHLAPVRCVCLGTKCVVRIIVPLLEG